MQQWLADTMLGLAAGSSSDGASGPQRSSSPKSQAPSPPLQHVTKVYLAPRMLACEEDVSLLRAVKAVGWSESPNVLGASLVFNVCNPPTLKLDPGVVFSLPGDA